VLAVVDAGPLVAAVDTDDADHDRCVEVLHGPGTRISIPSVVVAEATHLIGSRPGARVGARFLVLPL
jgi:predicted nucleic acid-binding protein